MFGVRSGFACMGCPSFKHFWPLALVQQAQAAIVFVVRGLCGHFRFCALGLTRRSSRPAYCGRLILFVSLLRIHMPTAQVMSLSIAVTHSQVLPLVLSRSAGLRLLGSGSHSSCLVTARRLWSHLACAVSPRGCFLFHRAANPAVKLIRQRRAAYFVR